MKTYTLERVSSNLYATGLIFGRFSQLVAQYHTDTKTYEMYCTSHDSGVYNERTCKRPSTLNKYLSEYGVQVAMPEEVEA